MNISAGACLRLVLNAGTSLKQNVVAENFGEIYTDHFGHVAKMNQSSNSMNPDLCRSDERYT